MKVLVATEGSEFSQAAIDKCCKMFEGSENADIRIISVAEPIVVATEPFAVSAEYVQDVNSAALEKAKEVVQSALAEIREKYPDLGVSLSSKTVIGKPAREIVSEAEDWGADLIIMGSHGYGFWQRTMLGSVSGWVIHNAPCSVLVVRSPGDNNGKKD